MGGGFRRRLLAHDVGVSAASIAGDSLGHGGSGRLLRDFLGIRGSRIPRISEDSESVIHDSGHTTDTAVLRHICITEWRVTLSDWSKPPPFTIVEQGCDCVR
jgi:hypothetical protein